MIVASRHPLRWIALLAACCALVPAAGSPEQPGAAPASPDRPAAPRLDAAPMPAGFDYPQTSSTIEGWIKTRDGHRMRRHAWSLFAAVNRWTPHTGFIWQTWPTESQLFLWQYRRADGTDRPAVPGEPVTLIAKNVANTPAERPGGGPSPQLPGAPIYRVPDSVQKAYPGCMRDGHLRDGRSFQSNGDVMIARVAMNDAAFHHLYNRWYFDALVLDTLIPARPDDRAAPVEPMPSSAIVLKAMLWPVRFDGDTALPVWDTPKYTDNTVYAGFEIQSWWPRAVAITTQPPRAPETDVSYLGQYVFAPNDPTRRFGPVVYRRAPMVSVDRFYQLTYTHNELAALDPCDRALLDASAIWSYGRAFDYRDRLVLVAMHVMTKERNPGWTFQSAWWHDKARDCPTNKDCPANRYGGWRPTNLPTQDTWHNYFLVSTYGHQTQSRAEPRSTRDRPQIVTSGSWPSAYNPYIELAARHPIVTNCINCHHRAAWPSGRDHFVDQRFPDRHSSYLGSLGPNVPVPDFLQAYSAQGCLPSATPKSPCVLDGLATLDSMWMVSDRAGYPWPWPPKSKQEQAEEDN